jgi:transcription elongation factor Elf1
MPRRVGERAVRYANAMRVIFQCPHCGLETSYVESEVSSDGVACRSCKRFFLPVTFYKDNLACWACRRRLQEVHYREVGQCVALCRECAVAVDGLLQEFETFREKWLTGVWDELRRARAGSGKRSLAIGVVR